MIVDTMTEKELYNEFFSDMITAHRGYSDTNGQKFRRMVLKAKRFPVYAHSFYVSPRKNKWLILLEAKSKKDIGLNCRINLIAYYESDHGIYAIMLAWRNKKSYLILYPPHFFTRYAERMNLTLPRIDLIRHFFTFNYSYVSSYNKSDLSAVYGSTVDGIALGKRSELGNVVFKTFITYEMCKGEQIEKFAESEKFREEQNFISNKNRIFF